MTPTRHFCTYFDSNYLARGLALHQSLEENSEGDFRFYVLCLNEEVEEALKKLNKQTIVPIPLSDVETWDVELLQAKQNRSRIEYYFTQSPIFPLFVLEKFDCDIVTYLDADLMFFASPEAIFEELGDKSIFITEHRFSPHLKKSIKFGRFNVQCQSFRNDQAGISCLKRWREQCLEWCYDRLEDGKYADQKYLDEWPDLYNEHLVISSNIGIGVASWNITSKPLQERNGTITVAGSPLVFYHFAGFEFISHHFVMTGAKSGVQFFRHAPLFRRYIAALQKADLSAGKCGISLSMDGRTRHASKNLIAIIRRVLEGGVIIV